YREAIFLDPGDSLTRYVYQLSAKNKLNSWYEVLPTIFLFLKNNEHSLLNSLDSDNEVAGQIEKVYAFALNGLIRLSATGEETKVIELIEKSGLQEGFDPLLLALRYFSDKTTIDEISPEKRALVVEVLQRIQWEKDKLVNDQDN
ncbi:MAG: hypothetical protein GY866_03965, partial [Proteobacteria bacterium]|nr:hypothetical protein [Pseudomonadota bacterium]